MVDAQPDSAPNSRLRTTLRNLMEVALTTAAIALIAHVDLAGATNQPSNAFEAMPVAELSQQEAFLP